ncbi:MAG: hypothetical protein JWQ30_1270, partial [Sediminibacterium sp.]|nr:hypothetical protein [Sediminibacterium sp.]
MWQDKGFLQEGETDVQDAMKQLATLIPEVREKYESLMVDELLQHPAPGKWSR